MNILDYRGIAKRVMINGSLDGDMREFFNNIVGLLHLKDEDVKPDHPIKLARMEAKREECRRISERMSKGLHVSKEDIIMMNTIKNMDAMNKKSGLKFSSKGLINGWLYIVCGDGGFGSKSVEYYKRKLERANRILSYNNVHVIFVRGNNDDPSYFDGNTINMSNIKAVPDYTVITTDKSNILCIGGAVSPDRAWRRKQEERISKLNPKTNKKMYWEKECAVFDKSQIDEIISSGIKIDTVVSHTAPSFVTPQELTDVDSWGAVDKDLFEDTFNERVALDKVFETLRDGGSRPNIWFYAHFNVDASERRSKTIFKSLAKGSIGIDDFLKRFISDEEKRKRMMILENSDDDDEFDGFDMEEDGEHDANELIGEAVQDGMREIDAPNITQDPIFRNAPYNGGVYFMDRATDTIGGGVSDADAEALRQALYGTTVTAHAAHV